MPAEPTDPAARAATAEEATAAQRGADAGARSGHYVENAIGIDRERTEERISDPGVQRADNTEPNEPEGLTSPLDTPAADAAAKSLGSTLRDRFADHERRIVELERQVRELREAAPPSPS